ncbi:MAG: hypothetical protein A2Z18_01050 [Armatimonadetes bacterium RBG_16_58_9]|nr:MAG: hypothetical protein A2Z18_01050 [Armatimonadetes bacterium RBG_16_58_9]
MDKRRLEEILGKFPRVKIAVIGDFFLDRYFVIDSDIAEISIETGRTAHQVVAKRLSPGAAGTVVSNLMALGVGQVKCLGVIGVDGEGFELAKALDAIGADSTPLIGCQTRVTPCYTKPMLTRDGAETELDRIDIKNRSPLAAELEQELIRRLECALPEVDAVIIADQVQERNFGAVTDNVREAIRELGGCNPERVFFVDSRVRIGEFRNVIIKPNMFESVIAAGAEVLGDSAMIDMPDKPGFEGPTFTLEQAKRCAGALRKRTGRPVFMTAEKEGIFIFDEETSHVHALVVDGEIDPVGAGDSCTAGIVSALCGGATLEEAALLGNIVASITVRKIGQTGTASPEEVVACFTEHIEGVM